MWLANPKSKTSNVVVDGDEDREIRSKHEVLYVSNLKESSEIEEKYDVTYCDEKPGTICNECSLKYLCSFSEVPKLRG